MTDLLKFGLIGSGSQGRYLSEALAMTGRAELVACADPKPEATELAMSICGYQKAYSDYNEMLSEEGLDAVIVATIHDQLQPAALAAARAGKHVLVEKPMALNAAAGRELVAATRDAGTKLMVGYTLRFMPERILMRRLLDEGAIGEVVHVGGGQLIGSMGGWLGDPAHGGGPLYYIGAHIIDQVLWAAGRPVERVYGEIDWTEEGGVEAGVELTIRFEGGCLGHVCTSQKLGGRYGWLDVMGAGGRMRAEWESHDLLIQSNSIPEYGNLTRIHVPAEAHMPPLSPGIKAQMSGVKYIRIWMAELTEFVNAIEEDREPCVTGEDGVRVLEVIDAAFEAGRTGKPVMSDE